MAPRRASAPAPRRTGRRPGRLTGRLTTRRASLDDLATLVDHRRRMWRELRTYSQADLDRHDRAYRRWVRDGFARGTFLAWVVEDRRDTSVAGSGAVWLMPSQPRPGVLGRGETPYILSMFTDPRYRRQGVASRLVREMIRWARAHRYGRVVLHASRFGRPVYERLGFEPGSEMRRTLVRLPPEPRPRSSRT